MTARFRRLPYGWSLSPWVALNASPAPRLLPDGYFGTAVQRSDGGTVIRLFRTGTGMIAEHTEVTPEDLRARLASLTDLAWVDARERAGLVVTTDADGYIRSIVDA